MIFLNHLRVEMILLYAVLHLTFLKNAMLLTRDDQSSLELASQEHLV